MDGKDSPAAELPEVVGRADQIEAKTLRDASLRGARLSQVPQGDVAHEVHALAEEEGSKKSDRKGGIAPGRRCILGVHEEVHGEEAEEDPVMDAIFEYVCEGHGVI